MLPDERKEVCTRLIAARQKLVAILEEERTKGASLKTISQIAGVQRDLRAAAVELLCCQIRTTLQAATALDGLDQDDERKKLIEQYQALLKFSS